MSAYYNESDPRAAAWLRELIKAGHIAPGDVDERSIEDVCPNDLREYRQCHFFAGIGVWSYSLRCAGWPDDRPIWTGSCPCQPFSAAGKGGGFDDERHLWPSFFHLIVLGRPGIVVGEQVASKNGLAWLDLVSADMEAAEYAFGAVDLCAAGVGAPHIRQRLYFGAHDLRLVADRVADAEFWPTERHGHPLGGTSRRVQKEARKQWLRSDARDGRATSRMADADGTLSCARPRPTNGFWGDADRLFCRDGKWRPVEPGAFPLAHGAAARLGRLRGYGNAIVAPLATEFLKAFLLDRPVKLE